MVSKDKPKNIIEFIEIIYGTFEREFEIVNINVRYYGLEVEYGINYSETNEEYQACFIPYPDFDLPLSPANN